MSATLSAAHPAPLKRKRDVPDPSQLDAPILPPPNKRPRGTGQLIPPSTPFLFLSNKPLIPTSSCRLDPWLNPSQQQEAGPSSLTDLQLSLHACSIDSPKRPFGFDTTLSNIQFGFSRSEPYRFTSPLSPDPAKRKRSKCKRRTSKLPLPPLLKVTLRRNHILSLRKRFPELLRPVSPTHPDSCPQLDDDDEFDDDEEDEIIDDFDDGGDSQVDDILNLYGGHPVTPDHESVETAQSTCISLPETLIAIIKPKPQPLQPSHVLNILPTEDLASRSTRKATIVCGT